MKAIVGWAVGIACLVVGCAHVPQARHEPVRRETGRFAAEIEAFRREDRERPAPEGSVVFYGSSSIRLWSTLASDMAPLPVLNRGFGGSNLSEAIEYAHELVSVHEPSVVVIFSGTNDLAGTEAKSAVEVRDLARELFEHLWERDAQLPIAWIAITPTLARVEHLERVREANRLIRADCDADPRLEFIDPTPELADAAGRPDAQWFLDDRLHLNSRGYTIWTRHIRPVVERLWQSRAR